MFSSKATVLKTVCNEYQVSLFEDKWDYGVQVYDGSLELMRTIEDEIAVIWELSIAEDGTVRHPQRWPNKQPEF